MIELKNISVIHGERAVFSDISVIINPGECACFLGASGSGKTTLINLLLKYEKPSSGAIRVDGVDLWQLSPRILRLYRHATGAILQEDTLCNIQTVAENLAFPLEERGLPDAVIGYRVINLLKEIGLHKRADYFPPALPSGERRLIEIARAVIASPRILFADEPLDRLDITQAARVIRLFKRMNREGTTLVICTRDASVCSDLKGRAIELKSGGLRGEKTICENEGKPSNGSRQQKINVTAVTSL